MAEEPTEQAETTKPFWSGVVTFGLVSVPVSLFPATRGTTLRLRMVDAQGSFLERRFFGANDDDALDPEDLVRGYELEKDRFVTVEDDELEALDPEKSREIDLAQFVDLHTLSPLHYERAYFLVPDGSTTKAYRLRAETLRFVDEVRSPEAIGLPPKVAADAAAVAQFAKAIKTLKAKTLDLTELEDRRSARIVKLAEKKLRAGTDVVLAEVDDEDVEESTTNVVDLMEVLKERLQGKLRARAAPASNASKRDGARVDELESKNKTELYEMAQTKDIPGRSTMSKAELIDALVGRRGEWRRTKDESPTRISHGNRCVITVHRRRRRSHDRAGEILTLWVAPIRLDPVHSPGHSEQRRRSSRRSPCNPIAIKEFIREVLAHVGSLSPRAPAHRIGGGDRRPGRSRREHRESDQQRRPRPRRRTR